jgi:hypothetical protein
MKLWFPAMFLTFGACFFPASATAATASASFGVTVMVEASCQASVTPAAPASFTEALAAAPLNVQVECTNSTPVNVALSASIAREEPAQPRRGVVSYAAFPADLAPFNPIAPSGFQTALSTAGDCIPNQPAPSLSFRGEIWAGSCVASGLRIDRITVTY